MDVPDEPISGDPADDLPVAQVRRFCNRCGLSLTGSNTCACRAFGAPPVPSHAPCERPLRATILLYAALLIINLVALSVAISTEPEGPEVELIATLAMTIITLIVLAVRWSDVRPALATTGGGRTAALGVGIGCCTLVIAWTVISVINHLAGVPVERYSDRYLAGGYGWSLLFLSLVVQPALIEEFVFRGLMFNWLLKVLRPGETVLVTAGLFMMLHLSPMMFPHTFLMGIAAGWLRLRTGSIWPCVALHATHNGLVFFIEFFTAP